MKTLLDRKQHYTMQEISNVIKFSSGENHLHQLAYVSRINVWHLHILY